MDINSLIPIILPPVLTVCFGAGAALWHIIKNGVEARIPANILTTVETIVTNVVHSIEVQYEGAAGADKKTAALNQVAQILQSMHLNVSSALLSSSIDYAVHQMNQAQPIPFIARPTQVMPVIPSTQPPASTQNNQ